MKKIFVLILAITSSCFAMELENIDSSVAPPVQNMQISAQSSLAMMQNDTRGVEVSGYIPRYLSITNFLRTEGICCFCIARWVLQPINILAPIVTSALLGTSEYFIKSNPERAETLNLIGLGFSIADFITGVLLVKINDKLEQIDNHMAERQNEVEI